MCLFLLSEIPSGSAQLDIHRGASLDFAMDRIVTYNRAAHAVGVSALRAAFRRYVFYYGTAGKGDSAVKAAHAWAAKAAAKVKARKERSAFHETEVHFGKLAATRARRQMEGNKILNLFDPGMRFDAFQNDPDGQMMDMYYGQAGNDLYLRRDPVIGEFVHRAMGYVGNYGDHRTGRDAWFATFNPGQELAWAGGPVAEGWNRNQLLNGTSGAIAFNTNVITFAVTGSLTSGQTFILFDGTNNHQFTGLAVDGSNKITSGLSFTGLSGAFQTNSYLTLAGGDIVLNAVPEPAPWLLLAFSLTTVMVFRRRRA